MAQAPYSIRFPKALRERLDHLVTVTKRPMSFFIHQALEEGRSIEVLEAIYLAETEREQARARELESELKLAGSQMSLV